MVRIVEGHARHMRVRTTELVLVSPRPLVEDSHVVVSRNEGRKSREEERRLELTLLQATGDAHRGRDRVCEHRRLLLLILMVRRQSLWVAVTIMATNSTAKGPPRITTHDFVRK